MTGQRRKPRRPRREYDVLLRPGKYCVRLYGPAAVVAPLVVAVTGHAAGVGHRVAVVRADLLPDLLAAAEERRVRVHIPRRPVPLASLFDFTREAA